MKLTNAPQAIVKAFQVCAKRFPVSATYILVLSIFLIFNIFDEFDTIKESIIATVIYYLSVGFVLSLTIHLWQEEGQKRRILLIVNTVAHLILLADAIYIYNILEGSNCYYYEIGVAHVAVIFSLVLSLFFLSFFKEKDDIALWNFAMRLVVNAVVCYLIGQIMWGGLSLLLVSFNSLFGIDIDYKWYMVIGVLSGLLLSSWLFLGRIPFGKDKHDHTPVDSGFLNAVMRFLFLPLVGLYIIVLYIYAIQIIIKWELPNGWVSGLVVASMVGLIVIELGLYPVRKSQRRKADNFISQYLPVVILPLLVLMTVGIARRFSDYGITPNRLYLLTLNLWFYFVCITLFLTKARRINWIANTFAVIFLLTSVGPTNYFSITRKYMDNYIAKVLVGEKLPFNEAQYKDFITAIPEKDAIKLNEKLMYLDDKYGSQYTEKYVQNARFRSYQHLLKQEETTYYKDDTEDNGYIHKGIGKYAIDIPAGYNRMVNVYTPTTSFEKDQHIVKVVPTFGEEKFDTVFVNIDTLRSHKDAMPNPILMPCSSEKTLYYVSYFSISTIDSTTSKVDVSGFILQKK
ncbi:MAG: DUF4153 domain-containing protein [Salinivirgaceae bacterium]|nr:DUF4153 domain-containing protein [Salinivirgaceae bacterium]